MRLTHTAQVRRAQTHIDNACDCCGHGADDDGDADWLRLKIKESPAFVCEAINNAELDELITAYLSGDLQHTHDAIADIVADYLPEVERRAEAHLTIPYFHSPDEMEVVEKICNYFGVAA